MANKKFIVKNGLTTQNVSFVDDINSTSNVINVNMIGSDTLSFSGDSGQLFSITDSLAGTIFAVNDISGVPSIEVDDDGTIRLAETFGNVLIGTNVDDGTNKVQINGNTSITGTLSADTLSVSGNATITGNLTVSGNTTFVNTNDLVIEDKNIVLANGSADAATADGAGITIDGANAQFTYDNTTASFQVNQNFFPDTDATYDLGSTTIRWNNIYTTDLHLSNEGKEGGNDVDGTTGNWTLQEGEDNIYMINNITGKKYKIALEEVK